jgi:hypothetical protein
MWTRALVAFVLLVVGGAAGRAGADVMIFQDGFEADLVGNARTSLAQWNVVGNVDVVATTDKCDDAGGTSRCLDLDGTGSLVPPAIVTRTPLLLDPGEYELSFDLAGSHFSNGTNSVAVALGDAYAETFERGDAEPFETIVRAIEVPARTTATLSFTHAGGVDNVGLLLDNVRLVLRQDHPPVPAGGFEKDVAKCQQAIGRTMRGVVSAVLNAHAKCLQAEASGKPCDAGKRDTAIADAAAKARAALDKVCSEAGYEALGHLGPSSLTRDRLVLTTLDAVDGLVRGGYLADYANLP